MIDDVKRLESERYAAMLRGDVEVLSTMLHDELVYTHSLGDRDSKSSYLDKVGSGFLKYRAVSHETEHVIEISGGVILAGSMRANVEIEGQTRELDNSTLAVWVNSSGRWQFAAFQPTPVRVK